MLRVSVLAPTIRSCLVRPVRSRTLIHHLKPLVGPQRLYVRFNSSNQSPPPSNEDVKSTNEPQPKPGRPKNLFNDLKRLIKLAKPETKVLAAALLCLVTTSSVSMSLPLFIGKIIDTTKAPLEDAATEITILGLPEYQFYTSLLVLFGIGASANFGRMYLLRSAGERLVARLRSRVFSKILSQDSYFFDLGPSKNGMKYIGWCPCAYQWRCGTFNDVICPVAIDLMYELDIPSSHHNVYILRTENKKFVSPNPGKSWRNDESC